MKIKIKNKGLRIVEFTEYFKTLGEFAVFINGKNKFINVDNIPNKVLSAYNRLKNSEEKIKYSILDWRVLQALNFKYKRPIKIEFWEERGFGIKEFNDYCNNTKIGNNQFKELEKYEPVNMLSSENIFEYGKYTFNHTGCPMCNLCHTELLVKVIPGRYRIEGCGNKNCASHLNKEVKSIRQLAFLPLEMFKKKNERINLESRVYKEYWLLNGYIYEQANKNIAKIKSKLSAVHQNSAKYYEVTLGISQEEAELRMKQQSHWSSEFIGYNDLEDKKKAANIQGKQIENNNKFLQKKQDEPWSFSAVTSTQIYYWINKGFSEDDARKKVSERQKTFSKEICIDKYGKEEGVNKFNERQVLWNKSLSSGGSLKIGYSKCSQELFYSLLEHIGINDRSNIFFATKNNEYKIMREEGGAWMYDFADIKRKKIIEFHGDIFHGNPVKYLPGDYPHPFRKTITAKEMWDKDELKKKKQKRVDLMFLLFGIPNIDGGTNKK